MAITTDPRAVNILMTWTKEGSGMRHFTINLKALPEQRDLIDQAASLLGKSRSEFMLEATCDRAQAVMLVPQNHELTTQEASAFLSLAPIRDQGSRSRAPQMPQNRTLTPPRVH